MISILMSCYKSNFDYLREQIDSIIHQTERDLELLIYNDGVKGLSNFLIERYKDKRIKYYSGEHKGCAKAYNYLLNKAKGEYICFCDHDDIWRWDKLETEKKYLDEHPDVDCVFGWLNWFGKKEKAEAFEISDEDISKELLFWQPIKNPTVMFRKERFGEYDSPYDRCSDYWFWSKHYDRHYHLIPKFMVNYRRHESQMTANKLIFREETAKIIQRNMAMFGKDLDLNTCKKLDRYSKTYDEGLKKKTQREIFG
ncbi:MAG: glycosyltransferase [Methanobrevibacter sp.]|nr:glycosyltransferase [Methanobrevibacter sp.]